MTTICAIVMRNVSIEENRSEISIALRGIELQECVAFEDLRSIFTSVTMALIKDVPVGQLFAALGTMFQSAHSSSIVHVDDIGVAKTLATIQRQVCSRSKT
jgi:hypothetical protein